MLLVGMKGECGENESKTSLVSAGDEVVGAVEETTSLHVEYHNATSYSPFTSRHAKRRTLFAIDALYWYKARLRLIHPFIHLSLILFVTCLSTCRMDTLIDI